MSQNRSVLITGCGIVSAIGQNCGQVLDSLLQVRTGVGPLKYLKTEHTEFPVGEVKLSDEEMERLNAERKAKQDAIFGKVPTTEEEEDDEEDGEAFVPVQQQDVTPEDFAAEAASEEAARAEDADAGYGFDE